MKGEQGFLGYYDRLFGQRWPKILDLLKQPVQKVSLVNPFQEQSILYTLDPASVWVAEQVQMQAGQKLLDLCSAPGGKALTIFFSLRGRGDFVLNELSKDRLIRLRRVFREQVPNDLLPRIQFSGSDGSRWGLKEQLAYDRVLVDAPCSGERHLLSSPKDLSAWSEKRSKGLAVRQHALLCSAFETLKVGGQLVYSTCSLSPLENDEVIRKFIKKRGSRCQIQKQLFGASAAFLEESEFGWNWIPSEKNNAGPMFACRLERISE